MAMNISTVQMHEMGVLIRKESLGLLSTHQTGCWPCNKQACNLLTAKCQAAKARPSHMVGTAPKAWQQSVFQRTTSATSLALQGTLPSNACALDPETLLLCCTQAPLFRNVACMSRGSFPGPFPQSLGRKALQSSCLTDQL